MGQRFPFSVFGGSRSGAGSSSTDASGRPSASGLKPGTSASLFNITAGGSAVETVTVDAQGKATFTTVKAPGQSYVIDATARLDAGPGQVVAPAAPTITLTPALGQVSIAWTDGATGGSAITSHGLYRGTVSGNLQLIGFISTGSPYVDTGLTNGTAYIYQLSAKNGVGESVRSAEATTTPSVVTTYLGQVATSAYVPTAKSASSSAQLYYRKTHFATDALTSLQLAFANWWVGAQNAPQNGQENAPGGAMTLTASVEYPAGTITQVKFGGAALGTAADGATILSDVATLAQAIPKGAKFWTRVWQSQPLGVIYSTPNFAHADDQCTYAATTPDLTLGGSTTAANSAVGYGPSAIIANTLIPSVFGSGDSRMRGTGDTADATGDAGEVMRSVGANGHGYINAACGSDQVGNMVNNYTRRAALAAYCSHAIFIAGSNDMLIGGATAAQVQTRNQTMIILLKGKVKTGIVDIATLAPMGSSGNTVNSTVNPVRVAYNALVRSNQIAGARLYYEIADLMETARDSGIWKSTPQAYSTDWLHETQYAYKLLPAGNVIPASNFTYPAS